jgi:hypothetical protein
MWPTPPGWNHGHHGQYDEPMESWSSRFVLGLFLSHHGFMAFWYFESWLFGFVAPQYMLNRDNWCRDLAVLALFRVHDPREQTRFVLVSAGI